MKFNNLPSHFTFKKKKNKQLKIFTETYFTLLNVNEVLRIGKLNSIKIWKTQQYKNMLSVHKNL